MLSGGSLEGWLFFGTIVMLFFSLPLMILVPSLILFLRRAGLERELYAITNQAMLYLGSRWPQEPRMHRLALKEIYHIKVSRRPDGTATITFLGEWFRVNSMRGRRPSFKAIRDADRVIGIAQEAAHQAGHEAPTIAPSAYSLLLSLLSSSKPRVYLLFAALFAAPFAGMILLTSREKRSSMLSVLIALMFLAGFVFLWTIDLRRSLQRPRYRQLRRLQGPLRSVSRIMVTVELGMVLCFILLLVAGPGVTAPWESKSPESSHMRPHSADDESPTWPSDGFEEASVEGCLEFVCPETPHAEFPQDCLVALYDVEHNQLLLEFNANSEQFRDELDRHFPIEYLACVRVQVTGTTTVHIDPDRFPRCQDVCSINVIELSVKPQ